MGSQDELERRMEELGEGFDPELHGIEARWGAETEQLYREKGFGTRIGWGDRPALIVIDMARAFCDPSYKIGCDQTAALEAISQLLAAARAADVPVYYTTIAYLPDGQDGGMFVRKIPSLLELQLDDPAATEIDARIAPAEGDVIVEKKYASAFFGTSLLAMLVSRGVDTLVLTGCSTSGCVRATAIDAVSHGYRVIVPEEAVSDRAPGPHYANLFDIDAKYGDVVSLADALEHLGAAVAEGARPAARAG
jgi:nicotinamidase-related amidase